MTVKFEYPDTVYATGADYIDPLDCGSLISYKITSTNYFEASIDLTDCNRKITWSFQPEDADKVGKAITILTEFRRELIKAGKKFKKLEEEENLFKAAQKK